MIRNAPSAARADVVGAICSDGGMRKVVLGALARGNQVLLAHRSPNKQAYPGVWDLPGGVVESGESALEALARELDEELGVQIVTGSAVHLADVAAGSGEDQAHITAWLVRNWHGTPTNAAPEEHEDIEWFASLMFRRSRTSRSSSHWPLAWTPVTPTQLRPERGRSVRSGFLP